MSRKNMTLEQEFGITKANKIRLKMINNHWTKKGFVSPRIGKTIEEFYGTKRARIIRQKMSNAQYGRKQTDSSNQKRSATLKKAYAEGKRHCWNKGLTKNIDIRLMKSGKKISKANKGKLVGVANPAKRPETRNKISNTLKIKYKLGIIKNPMAGKHHSIEASKKISNANTGKKRSEDSKKRQSENTRGAKSHLWLGGKSFEPYGIKFNKYLKNKIRIRDSHRCQQCFKHESELFTKKGRRVKLTIHHIDYNKRNNAAKNLISLCWSCHSQTNFKRKDWVKYFAKRISNGNK